MLKGEAVWSFTVMFIQMWEWKTKQLSDYENTDRQIYPNLIV